ncbi:MAG: hypothetical protein CFH15_01331 [Alphaproteobacteria bacterium MarineAlpha5_Bin5]|nr:MAG: hypothetical protein CFH15_01331 [Alphaproteobacteria bacterium MarineAlpha5_Bin5]PPR49200.1 MAG: hypothetical protein CFH14_01110 [Alphaproteobacteria bacterium MarineAlpha5_Bin4]|tara:strand:+ start:615 stop:926 length:312 start_codon:yes stop_codon:yes gene_type:complete
MNKSVVFKNKFYLFLSFFFTFCLFIYLLYFLINGQRGLLKFLQLKNQNFNYINIFEKLSEKNLYYSNRTKRLQPNTIDLDYLDEKLRKNTGLVRKKEIIVVFD